MIRRISWHWREAGQVRLLALTVHYTDLSFGRSGDGERFLFAEEDIELIASTLMEAKTEHDKVHG
jgi:hypothetical protein